MHSGLLKIASNAYLISILRRQQVAQIQGSPIYMITAVSLIPLSSQSDATTAIKQARETLRQEVGDEKADNDDSSGSSDDGGERLDDSPAEEAHHRATPGSKSHADPRKSADNTSIAQDVIGRQGQYGRFAEKWFSRKGWRTEGRRAQGMSTEAEDKARTQISKSESSRPASSVVDIEGENVPTKEVERIHNPPEANIDLEEKQEDHITNTLVPKLLRTTKMLLSSHSFFFSYDYDITRRIGTQVSKKGNLPLYKSVDPLVSLPFTFFNSPVHIHLLIEGTVLLEPSPRFTFHRGFS